MTTSELTRAGKANPPGPLLRFLTGSMARFWFLLLAVSLGLAALIYWIWLRGIS